MGCEVPKSFVIVSDDMNSRVDRLTICFNGQINDYQPRPGGVTEFGL